MAEAKTIDQLPNKLSLAGSDLLPVDDGVQSYKVPFSTLLAAVPGIASASLSQDGTSIVVTYRDGTSATLRTSDPAKQDALTFDQTPTEGSNNPVTSDGIADALAAKQDTLTLDNTPTENSNNPVKSGGVYSALSGKQDTLTFDNNPTENSDNPVKSGGVYTALDGKQDVLTFDQTPTENSTNPVTSGGVKVALTAKQDALTFDNVPTENSNNPVKSGGVYSALSSKQDTLTFDQTPTASSSNPVTSGGVATALAAKQDTLTFDNTPTLNSDNPVKSGGVAAALAAKQGTLTFDQTPTASSSNPVTSGGVKAALDTKQGNLTFDQTPTASSSNPVTSGGVATALAAKQDTLTFDNTPTENSDNPVKSGGVYSALATKQDTLTFDNTPTENSDNPVKSGGIKSAIDYIGAQISAILRIMASAHTTDWNVIKQIVSEGYGEIAYPVGSQFAVNHATYGNMLFDVLHHVTPNSDQLHKDMLPSGVDYGMVLMMHHVIYSTQFDQTEAFYYADEGLTAGTYHVKIVRQPWYAADVGKYFQFTLTSDVPVGGVLCWDGYNASRAGRNVTVYASLSATSAQQTASMSEGQGGTSLGDIDGTGNTNVFDRSVLGSNNWKDSGIRQWLNSDLASGWWESKTNFDRIISYYSRPGFLYGFSSEFRSAILESTHVNRTNTVFDQLGTNQRYTTTEKIFLPCNEEMNLAKEQNIECGKVFDFYKNAANVDRIKYDIAAQTTARYYWLRSPYPSYANLVRNVDTSGALSYSGANNASGVSAACIIGEDDQ